MAKFSGVCGRTTTDLEQKMFGTKGLQKWGLGSGLLGLGASGVVGFSLFHNAFQLIVERIEP